MQWALIANRTAYLCSSRPPTPSLHHPAPPWRPTRDPITVTISIIPSRVGHQVSVESLSPDALSSADSQASAN